MKKHKFKIGDRVRVLKSKDEEDDRIGEIGTILQDHLINPWIKFDNKLDSCNGHSASGLGKMDHCGAVLEDNLELVESDSVTKDDLRNTKFRVTPETSEKLQKLVFAFGGKWNGCDKKITLTNEPFLFIDEDLVITYGIREEYFKYNKYKELDTEALLKDDGIVIVKNYAVKDGIITFGSFPENSIKYQHENVYNYVKSTINKYEGNKMELKDMKQINLKEAKRQYEKEKSNAEVETAKGLYRNAVDNINDRDRQIKEIEEEKKLYQEVIDKFDKK